MIPSNLLQATQSLSPHLWINQTAISSRAWNPLRCSTGPPTSCQDLLQCLDACMISMPKHHSCLKADASMMLTSNVSQQIVSVNCPWIIIPGSYVCVIGCKFLFGDRVVDMIDNKRSRFKHVSWLFFRAHKNPKFLKIMFYYVLLLLSTKVRANQTGIN